ncbi:MAG: 3-hydroxyacyl-ACP dehydratase FabZ [Candidatus Omnitrophica bacterium]|nr:3-hydroxyacyl-ACP dehydratase FabZ [Candidatus Omnitrophota bacterium]
MGKETQDILGKPLDINMIQKILPHRYPFLLVDKIVNIDEKRATGIKNVTINEPFFQGHFPNHPVMPGVLIIEAMAQVGGVAALNVKDNLGKLAYFLTINKAKFRKPVVPGDQLVIDVDIVKTKLSCWQVHAEAKVDGEVVTEADLMFAFITPPEAKE